MKFNLGDVIYCLFGSTVTNNWCLKRGRVIGDPNERYVHVMFDGEENRFGRNNDYVDRDRIFHDVGSAKAFARKRILDDLEKGVRALQILEWLPVENEEAKCDNA